MRSADRSVGGRPVPTANDSGVKADGRGVQGLGLRFRHSGLGILCQVGRSH